MRRVTGRKMHKGSILFNFRADEATLDAIDKLAEAYEPDPGQLVVGGSKSRAIRQALLEAAALLDEKGGGGGKVRSKHRHRLAVSGKARRP